MVFCTFNVHKGHMYPLPENIIDQIKLDHSLIFKRKDGIIEIRCGEDITYDVNEIKENHEAIQKLADGKKVKVLSISAKYTMITNEARQYIAKGPHKDFICAEALLIYSLAQRMLVQFYIRLFKPVVPGKYFGINDKDAAEKWLNEFTCQ